MLRDSLAKFFKVDSLIENLTGYVETKIQLLRLEAKEEISKGVSAAASMFLVAFVSGMALLFVSISAALFIGNKMGYEWGFLILGAFYLILGVILFLNQDAIKAAFFRKINVRLKNKK